jgi:hypothetical protein
MTRWRYQSRDTVQISDSDVSEKGLHPRFRTKTVRLPGKVDFIRQHRPHIYKVIRKSELDGQSVANTPVSLVQALLESLGIRDAPDPEDPIRSRYEINFQPNEQQLEAMIEGWQQNGEESGWNDVGFKISGDSKIHWLSHSVSRYEEELEVERDNDEVVDSESLLHRLDDMEEELLGRLPG